MGLYSKSKGQFTVGLIIEVEGYVDVEGYKTTLRSAISEAAKENNTNLICFAGGALHRSPYGWEENQRNIVYNFISNNLVDGLLFVSTVGSFATKDELSTFLSSFSYLPIVYIGEIRKDIPSIIIDNETGMKEIISHLINEHKCNSPAFIKGLEGNNEAIIRYNVYKRMLNKYNINLNTEMVVQGNFLVESGREAIKTLLDKKKVNFDSIIASNDHMAFGAIEELEKRGIKIPEDIKVVGFDNSIKAISSIPPITTVHQPVSELGFIAFNLIMQIIQGKKVPKVTKLPSTLIIRQSCGCLSSYIKSAGAFLKNIKTSTKTNLSGFNIQEEGKKLKLKIPKEYQHVQKNITKIYNAIILIISNPEEEKDSFIYTFTSIIKEEILCGHELIIWQDIISLIKNQLYNKINDKQTYSILEAVFHQARVLLSEYILYRSKFNKLYSELTFEILNHISLQLFTKLEIDNITELLELKLPLLKINTCYICTYKEDIKSKTQAKENILPDTSTIIFALENKKRINIVEDNKFFPTKEILPKCLTKNYKQYIYVLEPLFHGEHKIGYAFFEQSYKEARIYDILRAQISNTLYGAALVHERDLDEKLKRALGNLTSVMVATVESRDPYTAGHQKKVSDLARAIATEMNLPKDSIEGIRIAGSIHDIGKIAIPAQLLSKPTKLTEAEFNVIKSHVQVGYDILKKIDFSWPIAKIVYQHHERLDGSGYPNGLKGDDIILESRIIMVADVVEAMASRRPYRDSLGIESALKEIDSKKNKIYDSKVVDACISIFKKKIYKL